VIGGYLAGLTAVRALAGQGIPVAVVATRANDIAHHSRCVAERHVLQAAENQAEALLALLERQGRRWRGWVLLPENDQAVAVLAQNRDRLARWYRTTVPPWEVVRKVLLKDLTYQAARDVGIDLPQVYGDATQETIQGTKLSFPALVKPVESMPFVDRFGRKLFVASNAVELQNRVQELESAGLRGQIVDLIPGPDSLSYNYCAYIDRNGEAIGEFGIRKLRKSPPFFGIGRVARRTQVPELREPTLELLRRLNWHGIAIAEYKLDPRDGRYRLMEVNGRCYGLMGLPLRAGVNYPLLAWSEAVADQRPSASPNAWDGFWVHFLDDVYYGLFFRGREGLSLRQYLSAYRGPRTYAVWSARDPGPFLAECSYTYRKAVAMGTNRRGRTELRDRVQAMPAGYCNDRA
jgi:D-aspartate ligase